MDQSDNAAVRLRNSLSVALEAAAELTGDDVYRRAHRAMHQRPAGRPAANDGSLIAQVRSLMGARPGLTFSEAASRVAREKAGNGNWRTIYKRLLKKRPLDLADPVTEKTVAE